MESNNKTEELKTQSPGTYSAPNSTQKKVRKAFRK